jgi:hypothetical protein
LALGALFFVAGVSGRAPVKKAGVSSSPQQTKTHHGAQFSHIDW